jgi:hypothetical protein
MLAGTLVHTLSLAPTVPLHHLSTFIRTIGLTRVPDESSKPKGGVRTGTVAAALPEEGDIPFSRFPSLFAKCPPILLAQDGMGHVINLTKEWIDRDTARMIAPPPEGAKRSEDPGLGAYEVLTDLVWMHGRGARAEGSVAPIVRFEGGISATNYAAVLAACVSVGRKRAREGLLAASGFHVSEQHALARAARCGAHTLRGAVDAQVAATMPEASPLIASVLRLALVSLSEWVPYDEDGEAVPDMDRWRTVLHLAHPSVWTMSEEVFVAAAKLYLFLADSNLEGTQWIVDTAAIADTTVPANVALEVVSRLKPAESPSDAKALDLLLGF